MTVHRTSFFLICAWLLLGCASLHPVTASDSRTAAQTPGDATYMIDGKAFTLNGGQATVESFPGAASKTVVEILGEPVSGDLDGDGVFGCGCVSD